MIVIYVQVGCIKQKNSKLGILGQKLWKHVSSFTIESTTKLQMSNFKHNT